MPRKAAAQAAAPQLRVLTLEALNGRPMRLVTPFGNRDFQNGILSTDSNDQAFDWLVGWAGNQKGIKVTESGVVVKTAVMTCPVCDQQVGGAEELADHNEAVHVQPESKGQPKPSSKE